MNLKPFVGRLPYDFVLVPNDALVTNPVAATLLFCWLLRMYIFFCVFFEGISFNQPMSFSLENLLVDTPCQVRSQMIYAQS